MECFTHTQKPANQESGWDGVHESRATGSYSHVTGNRMCLFPGLQYPPRLEGADWAVSSHYTHRHTQMHRRPRLQADILGKGRRDGVTTSVQAHTYSHKFTNRHVDLIFISGGDFLFCVCLEQHWRERPGESVWPFPPVMTIAGGAQHSAHRHTHRFLTARLICSDIQKLKWQAGQHFYSVSTSPSDWLQSLFWNYIPLLFLYFSVGFVN